MLLEQFELELGQHDERCCVRSAVVGGCLLTGGYGSAVGAALGACIIGMAFQGVIYAGWDSSWDFAFLGIVLFLAVLVNTLVYRRAQTARR